MVLVVLLVSVLLLFLEGTVLSLPLVLVLLLCITIVYKKVFVFPLAFFFGLLLDVLLVRPLGETSLFFCVFLLLILLYKRKYEIDSLLFVLFSSFVGSFVYLFLFKYTDVILQSIISCGIASLVYFFLHFSFRRRRNAESILVSHGISRRF